MRVAIAGAGNVGSFIANDLRRAGHEVHAHRAATRPWSSVPTPTRVEWVIADACEVSS